MGVMLLRGMRHRIRDWLMGSRNSQLSIYTEKQKNGQAQVLIRMIDKDTGQALVGTFSPTTVDRMIVDLKRAADSIRS